VRDALLCAQDNNTPLHCAVNKGHDSVVTLLLERGAYTEAKGYVRKGPVTQRMAARAVHSARQRRGGGGGGGGAVRIRV
jgi:hypothetical protein